MTRAQERVRLSEADIVPGPELDKAIDRASMGCLMSEEAYTGDYVRGAEGEAGICRYSRDLRQALDLIDEHADCGTLTYSRDDRVWRCEVDWEDGQTGERYWGQGVDRNPGLAVCRAILDLYGAEIVPA